MLLSHALCEMRYLKPRVQPCVGALPSRIADNDRPASSERSRWRCARPLEPRSASINDGTDFHLRILLSPDERTTLQIPLWIRPRKKFWHPSIHPYIHPSHIVSYRSRSRQTRTTRNNGGPERGRQQTGAGVGSAAPLHSLTHLTPQRAMARRRRRQR